MARVSNAQILTALEGLPQAIAAAIGNTAPVAVATEAVEAAPATASVDKAYMSHVTAKLQGRANDTGSTFVLYARTNKAGETKLAYCVADKFSSLTDRRIIGAVSTVSPE